jgi:hypothetical protein
VALLLGVALVGCTVGEGQGGVKSDKLFVRDCWNGAFDLRPDFFAANPFPDGAQMIRVQRGDNLQEVSDGLMILVRDTDAVRERLGTPVSVGVPPGTSAPGVPIEYNPDPAPVNLTLYLHDSCHTQNVTLQAIEGSITFASLFSGDVNEQDGSERLTNASFEVVLADPRDLNPEEPPDPEVTSLVQGNFRFYFQRGQPAQPFP